MIAADILIKRLPFFGHLPVGIQYSDDVLIALDVLPRIKATLAFALSAEGSWSDVHRKVCAAVVIEAWQIIYGKPKPYSTELWKACNDYWQACGRYEPVDNWKRDAENAVRDNHGWIRKVLLELKSAGQYKPR